MRGSLVCGSVSGKIEVRWVKGLAAGSIKTGHVVTCEAGELRRFRQITTQI